MMKLQISLTYFSGTRTAHLTLSGFGNRATYMAKVTSVYASVITSGLITGGLQGAAMHCITKRRVWDIATPSKKLKEICRGQRI